MKDLAQYNAKMERYKARRAALDARCTMLDARIEEDDRRITADIAEMERVEQVARNTPYILADLETRFKNATRLGPHDYGFLFFATALQSARWFLQPKIDANFERMPREQRENAAQGGAREKSERVRKANEFKDNEVKSREYPSCSQIYLLPVPYDATKGTSRIVIPGVSEAGKQLYGGNHHSATMGHDPILGYLYGTANILTRTITFKNPIRQTCEVHLQRTAYLDPVNYSGQYVTMDVSKWEFFRRLWETANQDIKRVPAAVGRQALHIQSDKFCRDGLPIPFLSAQDAQKLIDSDWNSHELWRLTQFLEKNALIGGTQALLSIVINVIIETLHKLAYDPSDGISRELHSAKTRRILEISNVIASSDNLLFTALSCDLRNLDVGGLAVTLYRLWKDEAVMEQIKHDFIYGSYYDKIRGVL